MLALAPSSSHPSQPRSAPLLGTDHVGDECEEDDGSGRRMVDERSHYVSIDKKIITDS